MKGDPQALPTLPFTTWLRALEASQATGSGMDVACGDCRGCCTSSYFIPVGPDETETLARIPKRLLFPAPGRPKGHFLLAYNQEGHCALFKDNACSIYADRPRACRAYDCRVFAATDLSEAEKPAIASQAKRWRFALPTDEDERRLAAVRAAARFLEEKAARFPEGFLPSQATQLAALAIRIHPVFMGKRSGIAEKVAEIRRLAGRGRARTG
jgi:Fe-S-cluster containining protein